MGKVQEGEARLGPLAGWTAVAFAASAWSIRAPPKQCVDNGVTARSKRFFHAAIPGGASPGVVALEAVTQACQTKNDASPSSIRPRRHKCQRRPGKNPCISRTTNGNFRTPPFVDRNGPMLCTERIFRYAILAPLWQQPCRAPVQYGRRAAPQRCCDPIRPADDSTMTDMTPRLTTFTHGRTTISGNTDNLASCPRTAFSTAWARRRKAEWPRARPAPV